MDLKDLQGKKTYLVSIGAVAYALGGWVSGYLDVNTAIQVIMAALGLGALRNGVTTKVPAFPGSESSQYNR